MLVTSWVLNGTFKNKQTKPWCIYLKHWSEETFYHFAVACYQGCNSTQLCRILCIFMCLVLTKNKCQPDVAWHRSASEGWVTFALESVFWSRCQTDCIIQVGLRNVECFIYFSEYDFSNFPPLSAVQNHCAAYWYWVRCSAAVVYTHSPDCSSVHSMISVLTWCNNLFNDITHLTNYN